MTDFYYLLSGFYGIKNGRLPKLRDRKVRQVFPEIGISLIFSHIKIGSKTTKILNFLPKMPFMLVFLQFFMYLHVLDHKKLKKIIYFVYFWKYRTKQGNFCRKWVPSLKIVISQNHIFEQKSRKKSARKLKFGQVREKVGTKIVIVQIF